MRRLNALCFRDAVLTGLLGALSCSTYFVEDGFLCVSNALAGVA